jgi:hypothetical protein
MLRLLTDLNENARFDAVASTSLLNSGEAVTGSFVVKNEDEFDWPTDGDIGAVQIWTESYRDGTSNFSPDASATGVTRLTALLGKYRALTDQFTGTPTAGTPLKVGTDGKLAETTAADGDAIAYCTKASHTLAHLQKDHSVIEFFKL